VESLYWLYQVLLLTRESDTIIFREKDLKNSNNLFKVIQVVNSRNRIQVHKSDVRLVTVNVQCLKEKPFYRNKSNQKAANKIHGQDKEEAQV
jgi:hypothetical protein